MAFPDLVPTARRAWRSGSAASLLSTAVLLWRGHRETGSASAPIDAVSHWVHGRRAYAHDGLDASHTGLGFVIHHASSLLWGAVFAAVVQRRTSAPRVVAAAAGVTALAALTDLRLVPGRLSPGFQHRLSKPGVAAVYAAVAVGLALSAMRRPP